MGSFNSAPKIHNIDSQDEKLEPPKGLSVDELVHHCKVMRGENRSALVSRHFLKPIANNLISNDITDGLRVLKLHSMSKGKNFLNFKVF